MSKTPTFPILFDEVKTISISFLSKHGYLKPNQWKSGTMTWSRNGEKTGSISIRVSTSRNPYLELDYRCNDTPINYMVEMVTLPSNLGKGVVWYFICPITGKRCRKLYLVHTYFYHRSAFKGCMYEKQTQSKKYRFFDKALGAYYRVDEMYQQLNKKHFKKQYAGKPTKKYLNLLLQIERAENISAHEIEMAFLL